MMTAKRPYLLRAIHQWILDNGKVPYMLVDATQPNVVVPKEHVVDGNIILNIDPKAADKLSLGNWLICFNARFARGYMDCVVPLSAVMGIYTSDTSEGYFFDPDDLGEAPFPKTIDELIRLEKGDGDGGGDDRGSKGKGGAQFLNPGEILTTLAVRAQYLERLGVPAYVPRVLNPLPMTHWGGFKRCCLGVCVSI